MTSTLATATASEWDVEALDLDAYLARIGYDGPREPTVETLRRVHRAHLEHISWETLDLLLDREVCIDTPSLQRKLVDGGRGGGCVETNLLFAAALSRLGFPVTRHMARAVRNVDRIRLRAHAVLEVEVEDRVWLADVGFGDEGPLEPILFTDGATLHAGAWTWRLDRADGEWMLRCLHHDGWFDVYSLRAEVHHFVDFDVATFWICHHRPFRGQLVAQRGEDDLRYVLVNQELTVTHPDGTLEVRHLDPHEVVDALRSTFRVTVTDADAALVPKRLAEVAERTQRLAGAQL